jgi:two-component system response regulator FlrC
MFEKSFEELFSPALTTVIFLFSNNLHKSVDIGNSFSTKIRRKVMNQLIIVENELPISTDLCKLFEKRNITVVKAGENNSSKDFSNINLIGLNIETLLCSSSFEKKIGGQEKLINFARNIKISKIVVIHESKTVNHYSVKSELGGALKRLSFLDVYDNLSQEIIFHTCFPDNLFAAGDEKTFELLALSRRVAATDVTVFINGPTGSGKEVLANYLHEHSPRKKEAFVAVNCAAIPENMLEAILFGHEKGAFTGASYANKGIFRAADKGTLLLDEISEMPLSLQSKLLSVLQERKVTPIGGSKDVDVDVRVVATTNRDMISEIKKGTFREDLYYRLNVFPLRTLALKDRSDDILPISAALLKKHTNKDKSLPLLTTKALDVLKSHTWPGNVRELENVLQRAMVICNEAIITENDIMIDNSLVSTEKSLADRIQSGNMVATA